ncbi:MAG: hypothetical protein OEY36_07700 [Gammaproteobacteria bacterium]|nr:hypothetical protein [Gammaproteobacteria bacterium]
MIRICLLLCFISLSYGCSLKSSFTESPASWTPPGITLSASAQTNHDEDNTQLENLTSTSAYAGYARANLIGAEQENDKQQLKDNVRLLIAGDSWAFFDIIYKATENKLKTFNNNYNIEYLNYSTDKTETSFPELLGIPGAKVIQWQHKNNSQMIINALRQNSDSTVLVLYLTGNDWFRAYECDDEDGNRKRYQSISKNLNRLVSDIYDSITKTEKRDFHIVVPGYSKLNFEQSLKFSGNKRRYKLFGFDNKRCPMKDSSRTINTALSGFLKIIEHNLMKLNPATGPKHIHYINNFNLFNDNDDEPTPVKNMLNTRIEYLGGIYTKYLFIDSIHLGKKSQHKIAEKTMEYILDKQLIK